jgi:hypothetical protein
MGRRKDQSPWTDEQDAFIRERFEMGLPARIIHAQWPKGFPYRTAIAINLRKQKLGIKTAVNPDLMQRGVAQPPPPEEVGTWAVQDDGAEIVVRSFGTEVRTLEELIARAKIDTAKYEVDKPETSMHETTVRDLDGKIRKVQNFRLVARFRLKAGPSTLEQVQSLIDGAFAKRQVKITLAPSKHKITSDLMQALVISDPHLAKYAWRGDTGWDDYDLGIGSRLMRQAALELTEWGDGHRPAERHIYCLGDLLHYDNPQGMTTGGTPQDRDTRLAKMLTEAQSVLCEIVERSALTAPTRVVMVGGNHDRTLSVAMQQILAAYFRHDTRVTVDLTATARKYIEWGHCLIGLTHGDTARKRLPNLMQVEQKAAWGRSNVRDWHHGHFHREAQTVTEGGVTIREHLALCPPDGWHSVEGYVGSPRGMDTLLYHKDGFLRGMWRSPVLDG